MTTRRLCTLLKFHQIFTLPISKQFSASQQRTLQSDSSHHLFLMLKSRSTHTGSDHSRGYSSLSHEGLNCQFKIDMDEALNKMLTTMGEHTCQIDQVHKETDDMRGQLEALKKQLQSCNLMVIVHNQILVMTMTCPCESMRKEQNKRPKPPPINSCREYDTCLNNDPSQA